jgi:hypothetical protein
MHRVKKDFPFQVFPAMVTKTFHPSDPLSRCPQALEAIDAERQSLVSRGVWDQNNPREFDEIVKEFPDAHFGEVFAIVGVKNYESANVAEHKWKGRIVFGGHNIRDIFGEWL